MTRERGPTAFCRAFGRHAYVDLPSRPHYKVPNSGDMRNRLGFSPRRYAFVSIGKIIAILLLCPFRTAASRDLDGDFREAHISTEPPCSQAPPRISQTHADGRRSEGFGAPSREGSQASFGLAGSNAWAPLSAFCGTGGCHSYPSNAQGAIRIPRRSRRPAAIDAGVSDRDTRKVRRPASRRRRAAFRLYDHQENRQCRDAEPYPATAQGGVRGRDQERQPRVLRLCRGRAAGGARPAI